jgi:hypothetical protein
MTEDKDETIYIGCQCHSPYHIVRVGLWDWEEKPPELLLELQADRCRGLWDRIVAAVRYVCGGENLGWHDVIPSHKDVMNLRRVIDNYTELYTVYEEMQRQEKADVDQQGSGI